jgi:drug/metabolite transporter (DMT)-like permease
VLALLAAVRRSRLPRGRKLLGAVIYGLLNFTVGYALMYLALVDIPAGLSTIVFAIVPLLTLMLAVAHRLEVLSLRGVVGSLIAVAGVGIAFGSQADAVIPLTSLVLLLMSALVAAESSVLVKLIPPGDPVGANLVGMTIGALLLGTLSLLTGETPMMPDAAATWASLLYVAVVGSVGLFLTFLWLLARWTASGTSYSVLLMPMWTMVAVAVLLGEPLSPVGIAGGAIVILGTWLGAFSRPSRTTDGDPQHERAVAVAEP